MVPVENRHQVKLDRYELVSCEGRIGRVGNQFQEHSFVVNAV